MLPKKRLGSTKKRVSSKKFVGSIGHIDDLIKKLPEEDRTLFDRFYSISIRTSNMIIPESMKPWVKKQFGSLSVVEKQKIVDIRNKFTFEAAAFNELRSLRPKVKQEISDKDVFLEKGDNFSKPDKFTPIDEIGRLKGKFGTTCANVAKYDAQHSLIIFKEHNPLKFNEAELKDHLSMFTKWCYKVNRKKSDYVYPFLMWNCLWRSAASIVHGHMQMLMTEGKHYPNLELFNEVRNYYFESFGSDYFEDLIRIHKSLGLVKKYKEFLIVSYLTPVKDKELLIFSTKRKSFKDMKDFAPALNKAISKLINLGVDSFNLAAFLPPLSVKKSSEWNGFPTFFRIVDRGALANKTADIGGMELYAGINIIESDPFSLIKEL